MSKYVFFEEIEISEYCSLDEAARWIAFGYVPEAVWDEEDIGCRRFGFYELLFGEGYAPDLSGFYKHEFEFLNLSEHDWDEYEKLSLAACDSHGRDIIAAFQDDDYLRKHVWCDIVEANGKRETRYWSQAEITAWQKENDVTDWLKQKEEHEALIWRIEAPLITARDSGRAKLYNAIMNGELEVSGTTEKIREKCHSDYEPFENKKFREFCDTFDYNDYYEEVPITDWSMSGVDWDAVELETPYTNWQLLRVKSEALMDLFPSPANSQLRNFEALEVSSGIVTQSGAFKSSHKPAKQRGRPRNDIKPVTNEFLRRKKLGELPEKKEAAIAEAIEWSRDILGQPLKRTSAQRALKPVYEDAAQK